MNRLTFSSKRNQQGRTKHKIPKWSAINLSNIRQVCLCLLVASTFSTGDKKWDMQNPKCSPCTEDTNQGKTLLFSCLISPTINSLPFICSTCFPSTVFHTGWKGWLSNGQCLFSKRQKAEDYKLFIHSNFFNMLFFPAAGKIKKKKKKTHTFVQ